VKMKELIMDYNFIENLYPAETTYTSHNSLFVFLDDKERVQEFFKFLFHEIEKSYKNGTNHVLENDNDRMSLIDIEYNFFIEKLGEWCEHYSSNKTIMTEYKKYKTGKIKEESEYEKSFQWIADFEIKMTIRERVMFDYGYDGWMIVNQFKKRLRFNLAQIFLNNMIGKVTYVSNFSKPQYAQPVTQILAKNIQSGKYFKFGAMSFHRKFLLDNIGKTSLNKLKKMGKESEKIITTSKAIKSRIAKLKLDEEGLKFYSNFHISEIEKTRNKLSGEWRMFEKSENSI